VFVVPALSSTAGWFPQHQGWYPKIGPFTAVDTNKVMKNWKPKNHELCAEASKGWNDWIEDQDPSTIVIVARGPGVSVNVDIKYIDESYVMDETFRGSSGQMMVILPFKPIRWALFREVKGDALICRFRGSHQSESNYSSNSCMSPCKDITFDVPAENTINASSIVFSKMPRKLVKPIHEFFLTAEEKPAGDDITMTTMCTIDRMVRIKQMAELYQGPISAAIYIQANFESEVAEVLRYWFTSDAMRRHVDIHLVVEDNIALMQTGDRPFPVNILRNIGVKFSRTTNVFYVEADFVPNRMMRHSKSFSEVKKRLKTEPKAVYVVPGLITWNKEISHPDYDLETKFPKDKEELWSVYNEDPRDETGIQPLSVKFDSHRAFPYAQWKTATAIFEISNTHAGGFEPYYISTRDYPLFEEVFVGCGQDKIVHFTELSRANYKVYGVPDSFIVHLDSTGMGTSWCKSTYSRFPKTEAFNRRLDDDYNSHISYNSRIAWWDEGDLHVTSGVKTDGQDDSREKELYDKTLRLQAQLDTEQFKRKRMEKDLEVSDDKLKKAKAEASSANTRMVATLIVSILLVSGMGLVGYMQFKKQRKQHPL
jgi:hypothetical protein